MITTDTAGYAKAMTKVHRENGDGSIYLGAMPGKHKELQAFLDELERRYIGTVVCLTPLDEIREKSPSYGIRVANGAVPVETFRYLPIPAYGAPETESERREFLDAVRATQAELAAGHNVFVHCDAGVGRSGTFAIAVLLVEWFAMERAIQAVSAIGSRPETESQRELLRWMAGKLQQQ